MSATTVSPFASVTCDPNNPFSTGPALRGRRRAWQVTHASCVNSFSPTCASVPSVAPPLSHVWNSSCAITVTDPIMPECFVPQYSAQKR